MKRIVGGQGEHSEDVAGAARWREPDERRRLEARLRASEAHHRAMMDAAPDCVVTVDEGGRILEFNPAAEATFGRSEAEVAGRRVSEVLIPPGLRGAHDQGLADFGKPGTGRHVGRRLERTAIRRDGSEFPRRSWD